ncbi:hypothetical protein WA588_004859 [Blastocystis sp. NMH]
MMAGFLPFDEPSLSTLFRRIQTANYTCPPWFSDSLRDLIARILVPDPAARASLHDISQHPWFLGDDLARVAPLRQVPQSPPLQTDRAASFMAPRMTVFELLALGIQRGISPITALLAPRLPANILLTASGPAVIYTQIMEVCRESGWGVTTDRAAGVFFVVMKVVEFVSVVEIRVGQIAEKEWAIIVRKTDTKEIDGYLQVERDLTSRLIRCIPESYDVGLNNRAVTMAKQE